MEELITRHVYPDIPVRVEYELTDKGRAMKPIIQEIDKWAFAWAKQRPEENLESCTKHLIGENTVKE
jgi:DNA-binding HxlR family transcriptional regulator